jgi:thiamine pyrophosphate-dependent acetolactate synthase large subunit-like protein
VLNSAIVNKSDIDHNHDERYYTKAEVDEMLSKYVSKDVVSQMIEQALENYSNSNPEIPDTPDVPETPEEPTPEYPMESIGSITDDNSIVIDETQLENGTYILRYIDSNNNIIDDFNDITSFEINN